MHPLVKSAEQQLVQANDALEQGLAGLDGRRESRVGVVKRHPNLGCVVAVLPQVVAFIVGVLDGVEFGPVGLVKAELPFLEKVLDALPNALRHSPPV